MIKAGAQLAHQPKLGKGVLGCHQQGWILENPPAANLLLQRVATPFWTDCWSINTSIAGFLIKKTSVCPDLVSEKGLCITGKELLSWVARSRWHKFWSFITCLADVEIESTYNRKGPSWPLCPLQLQCNNHSYCLMVVVLENSSEISSASRFLWYLGWSSQP